MLLPILFDYFQGFNPSGVTIEQHTSFTPKVDISEDSQNYYIEADIPNFKTEDLNIEVQNGILTISGKKEENIMEERKTYLHRERISTQFARKFKLPTNCNPQEIESTYQKEKLSLKIPKTTDNNNQPFKIKIN